MLLAVVMLVMTLIGDLATIGIGIKEKNAAKKHLRTTPTGQLISRQNILSMSVTGFIVSKYKEKTKKGKKRQDKAQCNKINFRAS
jgi:hypothetical protein